MIEELENIQPRQKIIYHTGDLARDCSLDDGLASIRNLAWKKFLWGEVELFQNRRSTGKSSMYDYIAVGKSYPRHPVRWEQKTRENKIK